MAEKARFPRLLALISVGALIFHGSGLSSGPAFAADVQIPTDTGVTISNPFTQGNLPPAFNSGVAAQLAAKFTACMNSSGASGLTGILGTITSGRTAGASRVTGGTKLSDACKTTDGRAVGDDIGDPSELNRCELLQTDGSFDPKRLAEEKAKIDQTIALLQCKENKLTQAKSQLDCISVQSNQITQQINSIQQTFTASIHKMQQDVSDLNSQSKNRASQIEEVNNRLGGDPKVGSQGLLGLQKATREMVSGMQAQVQGVKEEQNNAAVQRRSMLEQAQNRTMGLTRECFVNQSKAEFRCFLPGTPDNPALSAKDYLLCRYRQNVTQLGANGQVTQNATRKAIGEKQASELASLLDEIFSESPASSKFITDQKEFDAKGDQVVTVLSVADVERVYGKRLSAFDAKGIPVHDYVMKYMGSCFQKATVTVTSERSKANTALGRTEEAIKALERGTALKARTMLQAIAGQYGENMKGLTNDYVPLDISQCDNAQPLIQANCLDQSMASLNAQLTGVQPQANPTTGNYSMNIIIKGNDPKTQFGVACQGIDGCVTKLQAASTALGREQQRIDAFKGDYVGKAYRNTEDFVNNLSQTLSPQSEALRNQLKTLNAALSTLGVEDTVKIDDVEGEQLEQDDREDFKGLPKIPNSALQLIGGKMQPKLLNVAGDNFTTALSGIAKATTDLKNKESKAAQFKSRLGPLAETCRKKDLEEPIKDINTAANAYKGCVKYLCDRERPEAGSFSDLARLLGSLHLPGTSALSDGRGVLESGSSECTVENNDFTRKVRQAERKVETAKNELEEYKSYRVPASVSGDMAEQLRTQNEQKRREAQNRVDQANDDLEEAKKRQPNPSNCEAIATDIRTKFDKLRKQASDISAAATGAN